MPSKSNGHNKIKEKVDVFICNPENYSFLLNYSSRLCRNSRDAKDITQKAIMKLYERVSEMPEDSFSNDAKIRAYLKRCCYTCYLDAISSADRKMSHENADLESAMARVSLEQNAEESIFIRKMLSNSLKSLSLQHFEIISLAAQRYSYKEIEEMLKIPPGTVMSRLSRARSIIKKDVFGL